MKTIDTLNELLLENLRAVYDAEIMTQHHIPEMVDKIDSNELKNILLKYNKKIESKINRLDKIFIMLNKNSSGTKNKVIDKIIDSSKHLLKSILKKDVRDAAIIAEFQRINNLFISDYETAFIFSKSLHLSTIEKHLQHILEDEKETDQKVSAWAEKKINAKAKEFLFAY